MLFEEKIWFLSSRLVNFNLNKMPAKIILKIKKRLEDRNTSEKSINLGRDVHSSMSAVLSTKALEGMKVKFLMYDFTEALAEIFKLYCPWVKTSICESATYYFLWNLIDKANSFRKNNIENYTKRPENTLGATFLAGLVKQ